MTEPPLRIFEVFRDRKAADPYRRRYVDNVLATSFEKAQADARRVHGDDVIVIDVLAERQRAREQSLSTEGSSSMKKDEVKVGQAYAVKVSGNIVPVRLDEEHPQGGWTGTNLKTGKQVRIKSARRLRGPAGKAAGEVPTAPQGARVAKKAEAEGKDAKGQTKATRAKTARQGQKGSMSGLDAAAKVLEEAGEPLSCKQIVERAFAASYWQSDGKAPAATVYASIIRDVAKKGDASRFRKVDRGRFALAQ